MNPIFNNYYKLPYKPGYKVSKILHIVYILAYRIHPSGKYLTLAIKPNVNHEKDGQGVVSTFRNRVQPRLYCMISARNLGYMKCWIVIYRKP